jgi:NAD(P)-dependent dehydrogenase (short-subunit alcohol dehydrogenase family)
MRSIDDNGAKTFVVTGVTSGIGLSLARALTHTAEKLVIVGRDEARLRAATEVITGHQERKLEIIPIVADLGTLEGIQSLGKQLDQFPRLDVLIHNAGILPTQRRLTPDGFEESFATNHLAPFVLNRGLRRQLVASAPSRIVQVSAGLAFGASVDLEGDPRGARFESVSTYARTKRWNLLATLEFAAELGGSGVTVNAVHPGVVRTRLGAGAPGVPDAADRRGWLSPEAGARGPLHLATAPELAHTTGRFFDQTREMAIELPADAAKAVVQRTLEVLGPRNSGR